MEVITNEESGFSYLKYDSSFSDSHSGIGMKKTKNGVEILVENKLLGKTNSAFLSCVDLEDLKQLIKTIESKEI